MEARIAGILLCIVGLALSAKPTLIWKITESRKTEEHKTPSDRYMTVLRVVSGAALGLGVLLAAGIVK